MFTRRIGLANVPVKGCNVLIDRFVTMMMILGVCSRRTIPQMEIDAVSEFLLHLLTGNVDKLPTQTLLHKFWFSFAREQQQAVNYFKCMQTHHLTNVECYSHVAVYCGSRFGEKSPERHQQCNQLLTNEKNATMVGLDLKTVQRFSNYRSCFQSYRRRVDANCTPVLRKTIAVSRLRATKVVRATMDSMRPLLRALPSLRIIHLVRDPRAVARSRINNDHFDQSLRSAYSLPTRNSSVNSLLVDEASMYCRHATADIRTRLTLEREYPGRILSMRYEDVVTDPERRFRDVYKLLDEPVVTTALTQMQESAREGRTRKVLTKWQFNMTYAEGIAIARRCAEFYRLLNISPIDV